MKDIIKIGIVGSRKYTNKQKIKDFIFNLKKKYGNKLIIVSGGCRNGADFYAKKYALEFDLNYEEYPPFHESKSSWCPLSDKLFNKPYSPKNYFDRNKLIAKNSDCVVGFILKGHASNGTNSTLKYAEKFGKKTLIIW